MSVKSVQFTVAAHIMAAQGYFQGEEISSTNLAQSVNARPTFVRKSLSKLSKAGLVVTKRGKSGASVLARPPRQITLLDIHRASAAPPRLRFIRIPSTKGVRSAATSRNACRGFLLELNTASKARSPK